MSDNVDYDAGYKAGFAKALEMAANIPLYHLSELANPSRERLRSEFHAAIKALKPPART